MSGCTCVRYVVDYSDPERYHTENVDREEDPACPVHAQRAFDPGSDFPPDGATVKTSEGTATFRDGTMPGWWLTDGRYARPFDSLGNLLARSWAAQQEATR